MQLEISAEGREGAMCEIYRGFKQSNTVIWRQRETAAQEKSVAAAGQRRMEWIPSLVGKMWHMVGE